MKSLLRFIIHYHATFIFIIFELICLAFVVMNNHYQKAVFSNSASVITGKVQKSWSGITSYMSLSDENDRLARENARLKNELQQRSAYNRNFVLDSISPGFVYFEARVINNSVNSVKNYISIDVGTKQGVKKEMGVTGPDGVVGIIYNCSGNYSTVIPIINTGFKLSVKISRNNYLGSLSWNGKNFRTATMSEIPIYVDIKVGDTVVTSGFSTIFPQGLPVGFVDSYEKLNSTGFYEINVRLATDFATLEHIYVVDNKNKDEIIQLESQNDQQ
jgi:rod shape-determining protein MreC